MRLDMSQHMKMDQRMVLAPRMIQSMEILQLPLLALQERIEQELLANPVLELEEPSQQGASTEGERPQSGSSDISEPEHTLHLKDDNSKADDFERMANQGNDYDDYMDRSSYIAKQRNTGERDKKLDAMQNTAAAGQSLHECLLGQWAFIECDDAVRGAGIAIIDSINDAGYLAMSLDKIRDNMRQQPTEAQMDQAMKLIQTLEPVGVGARDLGECMLIQLQNSDEDRTLEIELVSNYLKDIEMNRYPVIVRKTGRSLEEIKQAIKTISRLDPRPGLQVSNGNATYIIPEIIIDYDEQADLYSARLTDGSMPVLRINKIYGQMLKDGQVSKDTKEFLQNSVRSARWLIESIEQRKATLLRVVNYVLQNQRSFFDYGPQYLKPLPMVDTASALGMHVGTVSRAVSGKYMQTPIGIFPLRSFFSGGTENSSGQSVSWDAVKARLQEIIDNEDKKNPYNDDELVEQLQSSGLTLARRTVAKYRNLMSIPPARRRKEFS
jgi:RNA polymerase sigma-54 factor